MTGKQLRDVLIVRVSRRQKVALRRAARRAEKDVSALVRGLIDECCRREADSRPSTVGSVDGSLSGAAA